MPDTETADVTNETVAEATTAVEGSSATTTEATPASPVETPAEIAGESLPEPETEITESHVEPTETTVEDTEVESNKPERKARTAKRIQTLLEDKKSREAEIASLKASLLAVQQPQPNQAESTKDEDDPTYWARKHNEELDDSKKTEYFRRYEDAKDRRNQAKWEQSVMSKLQAAKTREVFVGKLVDIHVKTPFLQRNEQGIVQIDPKAPVVQLALQKATNDGVAIRDDSTLRSYLLEAQVDLLSQNAQSVAAKAAQTKRKTQELIARTGLETGARTAPPTNNNRIAKLEKLADAGDLSAARELMRLAVA